MTLIADQQSLFPEGNKLFTEYKSVCCDFTQAENDKTNPERENYKQRLVQLRILVESF